MFFRAREMNFKVDGAKEQWKVLPATLVARQEKILNSRMAKNSNILTLVTAF